MNQPPPKRKLFPLIGESSEALHLKLVENLLQMFAEESAMQQRQQEYEREIKSLEQNIRQIAEQLRLRQAKDVSNG
jgi:hypothetical protein